MPASRRGAVTGPSLRISLEPVVAWPGSDDLPIEAFRSEIGADRRPVDGLSAEPDPPDEEETLDDPSTNGVITDIDVADSATDGVPAAAFTGGTEGDDAPVAGSTTAPTGLSATDLTVRTDPDDEVPATGRSVGPDPDAPPNAGLATEPRGASARCSTTEADPDGLPAEG